MATPNIVGVTSIFGNSSGYELTSNSPFTLVTNPASSGKVFKVNMCRVANDNGSSSADVTVQIFKADTSTTHALAYTIAVPADSALTVVDKDSSVYLREGDYLRAIASVGNYLSVVTSWEEIN